LGGKPQRIEIRGHTSRRPISGDSDYADHWDLAFRRCHNVMDYLIELGIDPERLRLSVAGPNEPLHLSARPDRQQRNPRVEVFMLEEVVKDLQGTREERDARYLTPDRGPGDADPEQAPGDS
jgi:chemotaxis protein MotB